MRPALQWSPGILICVRVGCRQGAARARLGWGLFDFMAELAAIAAFGYPKIDPARALAIFRRLGCRTCQYLCNPEARPGKAESVRRIAEGAGLLIDSVHGAFGPAFDLSCPEGANRRRTLEAHFAEGDLVRELGGTMVVVHPAPFSVNGAVSEGEREARLAALRESIEALAEVGERLGVTYLVENLMNPGAVGSDAVELAGLIRRADHRYVRMCFDTGHANMTSVSGSLPEVLAGCVDVVAYCHIHDNDGKTDGHLIPGQGTIGWEGLRLAMCRLGAHVPVMLELFDMPGVEELAQSDGLRDRLWRWLGVSGSSMG